MMELYNVMKREDILIRLAVLIFIGAGLNACLIIFAVQQIREHGTEPKEIPFITTSPELTILYLGVGICYSLATSLTFKPKRIVSPFYIQLVTATILITATITFEYFKISDIVLAQDFIENTLILFLLAYGCLAFAGHLQRWIVRRLLGVNGTRDNIHEKTYCMNVNFSHISKILSQKDFLKKNGWIVKVKSEDTIVLQTTNEMQEKHTLALVSDGKNENNCFLTLTSYLIKFDWLRTPDSVIDHEGIMGGIERLVKKDNESMNLVEIDKDQRSTHLALEYTLKVTKSPFGELANYPKRHIIVVGFLSIVMVSVSLYHVYDPVRVPLDTVINAFIFVSLGIVADVYSTVKEKIQSK